jgi:hypothetical protein
MYWLAAAAADQITHPGPGRRVAAAAKLFEVGCMYRMISPLLLVQAVQAARI